MRVGIAVLSLLLCACGTRTALDTAGIDAGPPPPPPPPPPRDAGIDAGPPDAGTDAGTDAGPSDAGPECVPDRAVLPAGVVDVVFVIDRSSSMSWTPIGGDTAPWDLLTAAMNDVFAGLDPRVGSGALYFPSGAFCTLSDELDIPIAEDNVEAILTSLEGGVIEGRSPVRFALTLAYRTLEAERAHRPNRFVVLLTDSGREGCRTEPVPDIVTSDEAHRDLGVDTFVVRARGYGTSSSTANGGGRRTYDAADYAGLRAALEEIERALSGCVFDVPFEPSHPSHVSVRVGGVVIPHDERRRDGWAWSGADEASISLFGEACVRRVEMSATVEAVVACDADAG